MKVSYLITVLVLVIAMVVPSNASAQNTVTNLNFNDPAACGGYLTSHPMDTIVGRVQLSADTTKVIKVYLENGVVAPEALRRVNTFVVNKHVKREVLNQALVQTADTVQVEAQTQFLLSGATDNRQYDIFWVECSSLKKYREQKGDTLAHSGKIPVAWARKYGFHVQASVGASLTKGEVSPVLGLGLLYDRAKWGVLLEGEVARTQLSSNAENAGEKYWTYRAQATVRFRPIQLDDNDVNRLFVYGGLGFEWFKTDSRRDGDYYFTSHGNYLYGVFGVGYTHRFFGKAQDLGFCFEYHTSGAVRQNQTFENYGTFVLKATYSFNVFPNKVNQKISTKN